jgi:hypothetical protein
MSAVSSRPEAEANYTYWPNGDQIENNQPFSTPGWSGAESQEPLNLTVGGGFQVAVTRGPLDHNSAVF